MKALDTELTETWDKLRKIGYQSTAVVNGTFAFAAYSATYAIQKKYENWPKSKAFVTPIAILGRCVTSGFICIGVSSWLCSYYCFNHQNKKNQDERNLNISKNHMFVLKSSVLLFSISTYYCIGLMAKMEIKEIDLPDIDLHLIEISPKKFIITGSILASILAIPTGLVFSDWIKDCLAVYNRKSV